MTPQWRVSKAIRHNSVAKPVPRATRGANRAKRGKLRGKSNVWRVRFLTLLPIAA
jgi:hypothetical protein